MQKIVFCLSLLISLNVMAQDRVAQILDPNELLDHHTTAFLASGRIIHVPNDNLETIEQLKRSLYLLETIQFEDSESDKAPVITEITSSPQEINSLEKEMFDSASFDRINWTSRDPLERANISRLSDYQAAQGVMDAMNGNTHDKSECYNRAHMWTYEALVNQRVNLGKLWIFFTRKYIREYRYKWWFHVSPYTEVGAERATYMLDRGFTMIPYTVENWKNIYMKNQARCPVVTNYKDYENRQEEAYCYFMYSSQYYWQPWQLKQLSEGDLKTYGYKESQLEIAYRDALRGRWNRQIPVLRNPIPNPNPNPRPNPNPNPRPEPRPTPPRTAFDLRVGDQVLHTSNPHRLAQVTFKQGDRYDVQFLDRRREILRDVTYDTLASRRGCINELCVGDRVINTSMSDEIIFNTIHGITHDGRFVVSYDEGRRMNGMSWGWRESALARTEGCRNGWCVGQQAYSPLFRGWVSIIGQQSQGLVLEIISGPNNRTRAKYYRDRLVTQ